MVKCERDVDLAIKVETTDNLARACGRLFVNNLVGVVCDIKTKTFRQFIIIMLLLIVQLVVLHASLDL